MNSRLTIEAEAQKEAHQTPSFDTSALVQKDHFDETIGRILNEIATLKQENRELKQALDCSTEKEVSLLKRDIYFSRNIPNLLL